MWNRVESCFCILFVCSSDSKRKDSRSGNGSKDRESSKERDKEKNKEQDRSRDREKEDDKDKRKQVLLVCVTASIDYHRFRWYTAFENKTPSITFPKFSVNHARSLQIGSKSTNHSLLAWCKEGLKVTLVAVIGGFWSDLLITCKTDRKLETFLRVFCFPQSRVNENGGNAKVKCYMVCTCDSYYAPF